VRPWLARAFPPALLPPSRGASFSLEEKGARLPPRPWEFKRPESRDGSGCLPSSLGALVAPPPLPPKKKQELEQPRRGQLSPLAVGAGLRPELATQAAKQKAEAARNLSKKPKKDPPLAG